MKFNQSQDDTTSGAKRECGQLQRGDAATTGTTERTRESAILAVNFLYTKSLLFLFFFYSRKLRLIYEVRVIKLCFYTIWLHVKPVLRTPCQASPTCMIAVGRAMISSTHTSATPLSRYTLASSPAPSNESPPTAAISSKNEASGDSGGCGV